MCVQGTEGPRRLIGWLVSWTRSPARLHTCRGGCIRYEGSQLNLRGMEGRRPEGRSRAGVRTGWRQPWGAAAVVLSDLAVIDCMPSG